MLVALDVVCMRMERGHQEQHYILDIQLYCVGSYQFDSA
jgi:hypothetical protein